MRPHPRFWKTSFGLWLPVFIYLLWSCLLVVYSKIFEMPQAANKPAGLIFGLALADGAGLLLMFYAVRAASRAMSRRNWKWRRMIPVYALLLPLFIYIQALIFARAGDPLAALFHRPPNFKASTVVAVLKANWAYNLIFYIAVVGGTLALFNYQRFREKERLAGELQNMLAGAQLQSLRVQLQPHFLFNVLNTISSYIYESPDTAVKIVARLSELLRTSLDSQHQPSIPLAQEMGIVAKYLEIEQLRFSDRLQVRLTIPEDTRQAQVPSFLLQPLVENAMRHGIAGQIAGGTVEIIAQRRGETLVLQVRDDGAGAKTEEGDYQGIGLRNTRSRLEKLYGQEYGFKAGNRDGGGFEVEITIPFRVEPDGPVPPKEKS